MRYRKERVEADGWTRLIFPKMSGYRVKCCGCGLTHVINFRVFEIRRTGPGTFTYKPTTRKALRVGMRLSRGGR